VYTGLLFFRELRLLIGEKTVAHVDILLSCRLHNPEASRVEA